VLGMSEDQAFKRIRAARAVRRYPVVAKAVADGRLHLSGVVLLAPYLSEENAESLVAEACGKSKAEIELILARRAPRPDVPERLEPVAQQTTMEVVPGPVAREVGGAAKVAPLAPARFALQVTIGEETQQKLLRAQALLRHQVPSGDLAEVLDRALDALLDKVERKKLGKAKAPRPAKGTARGAVRAARCQARGRGARRRALRVRVRRRPAVRGDRLPRVRPRGAGGAGRRGERGRREAPLPIAQPVRG
jgi:hypothetical protein